MGKDGSNGFIVLGVSHANDPSGRKIKKEGQLIVRVLRLIEGNEK